MGSVIVASILSLSFMFAQATQAIHVANGPIEVQGDTAVRIVASSTLSEPLLVAGEKGLYEGTGADWTMIAPAPPAGRIVSGGSGEATSLLLAGDHEPCGRGGSSLTLQRSGDGGQTWSPVDGAAGYRPLAIWPAESLALASSCLGLHVSVDDGLTWAPVEGVEPGWEPTSFAPVPQTDEGGPVVLVGLTGEGGTSYLRSLDFSEPEAPVVSSDLRTYYAIGGLAGAGDTYILAAMDGVWISNDAGASWERSRTGLEDVTLDRDPLEYGLPQDMNPEAYGLLSVALLAGERPGIVVGSVDGLYISYDDGSSWALIEGTSGRVHDIAINSDGTWLVYATEAGVFQVDIDTAA